MPKKKPPALMKVMADPYEDGMLHAVAMLLSLITEQRDAVWIVERHVRDVADDKKQAVADVLRPLAAQHQAAETLYHRLDERVLSHIRARRLAARVDANGVES